MLLFEGGGGVRSTKGGVILFVVIYINVNVGCYSEF